MSPDYYEALRRSPDPARRVGWRHRLGQATRFETVLALCRPGDRVLDLGAGEGALARYLTSSGRREIDYQGVERDPTLAARSEGRVVVADFHAAALGRADVVAAVGALVGGEPLVPPPTRIHALRRLMQLSLSLTTRVAAIVVLKQEVLQRRPGIGSDPALAGATKAEARDLATELGCALRVVDDVLRSDRVLYLAHAEQALPPPPLVPFCQRALEGPWGRAATPAERIRLLVDAGRPEQARRALHDAQLPDSAETRWLRDAINAM